MGKTDWTCDETEKLIKGVLKHGEGNWAKIDKENPELKRAHPYDSSLKDKVRNLKKANKYEKWILAVKNGGTLSESDPRKRTLNIKNSAEKKQKMNEEEEDSNLMSEDVIEQKLEELPDKSQKEWFEDEEETLKDLYKECAGEKNWLKKMQEADDRKLLIRHEPTKWRNKIITMQKMQLEKLGKVEERLSSLLFDPEKEKKNKMKKEEEKEGKTLSFKCHCGNEHTSSTMLVKGLKCVCGRTEKEMLEQVENMFSWVVYIILDSENTEGLSGDVSYVGYSKNVKSRMSKSHEKEEVKNATFDVLRVSIGLGEKQLTDILKPTCNIQKGSKKECRLKINGEKWIEHDIMDEKGKKYEKLLEDKTGISKTLDIEDHIDGVGIIAGSFLRESETEDYCMISDGNCECERKCVYRKIINALMGREIWYGLEREKIRQTIRQYRDMPRIMHGERKPEWTLEYTKRVLSRNKNITDSTRTRYIGILERCWERGIMEDFSRPWMALKKIQCRDVDATHQSIIVCLKSILSYITNEELRKLFGFKSEIIRAEYQKILVWMKEQEKKMRQVKTEIESKNWALLIEIEKAVKEMRRESKNIYEYQRVVWYMLELYQGCVRNEYNSLKVTNYNRSTDNYIESEGSVWKIILNNYKTYNAHGRQEFDVEEEVLKDLRRLVERRKKNGEEYLFMTQKGTRLYGSGFSAFMINGLERFMGKRIGSRQLRKIVVYERLGREIGIEKKEELARRMLHSVWMQQEYLRLF